MTAANGSPSAVEVKVAGTFATTTKEYDESALRLPIQVANVLLPILAVLVGGAGFYLLRKRRHGGKQ